MMKTAQKPALNSSKAAKAFNNGTMDYSPLWQGRDATENGDWYYVGNSNTFAYAATEALGVTPESVPHPRLPGYGPLPRLPK